MSKGIDNILRENTLNTDIILKPIYESEINLAGDKVKNLKLEGTAIVCDVAGINGRAYPKRILEAEVKRFNNKFINKGRAAGELNHPRLDKEGEGKDYSVFEMNLFKTCAIIEELRFVNKTDLFCKMKVVPNHEAGEALKALIEAGYVPGFSLRGAGSVIDTGKGYMEIADDYRLITVDVVGNPSFDDKALITPVYEAMKGNKVQILTESVDIARKEMLINTAIRDDLHLGYKKYNKQSVIRLLESLK